MSREIFLIVSERVQVSSDVVYLRDVAEIYLQEQSIKKYLEKQVLFEYGKNEIVKTRQVVSVLYIIKTMQQSLDNLVKMQGNDKRHIKEQTAAYSIVPITSSDCIVERIADEKSNKISGYKEHISSVCKIFLICLLCMFGGAFSIMAFHNDVGLSNIFAQFYKLVTGEKSTGFTILEISYSIGLMSGIVIFYNHIGKRRISKDPTPIEVSMRTYEQEMNQAMIQTWEREGKKIDVE